MTTNILIIFGYCFIFELFVLVTVVFSSILRSFVDRKTKERNYKYMVKNEEKLRKEAEKEKTNKGEKNIKDVLNFLIDKEQGILEFEKPVNLKEESIEFRIRSICIEPDEKSKITRGIYEIANIIPTTYDEKYSLHYLKATIQIPIYERVDGTNIPTGEGESVTIDLLINPENGVYVNNSSEIIKNIDIYCFINTEVTEEEKRNKEFNKKLTTSEKDMNELLENAVTEGLNEDEILNSENTYRYQVCKNNKKGTKSNIKNFDPNDDLDFRLYSVSYHENNEINNYVVETGPDEDKFTIAYECGIYILNKTILTNSQHQLSICIEFNPDNGYIFLNQNKTSKEVETVCFDCIRTHNDKFDCVQMNNDK